jgi:hypothetical protein
MRNITSNVRWQQTNNTVVHIAKEPHLVAAQPVATLTWSSVGVKPNTWKSGVLESSETPDCSELDSKGQNNSHWGVLGDIGKRS